ncbi:MAG: prepilin-type N-terminal cleavage/methylation domain-containing protein [Coriobacteriia bacterium]|nr:prepilin-type N-terminal cleavage/methylation domain-containing protein [Coriobacteriia bacterium]
MKMFRKDEGFTLVELMVVVLIIGILVAIAIPVFNAASGTARAKTCVANLRTLDGAVQQWKAEDPAHVATTATHTTAIMAGADYLGPYVKTFPTCPSDDATYTYVPASENFNCTNFRTVAPVHAY